MKLLSNVTCTVLLSVLAVACASSESGSASESSLDASAGRLLADVAWLADDAQEGRRAGTEAGRRAGLWIAARMEELGLEPAGEEGTWFQSFQVPLPIADGGTSSVVLDGVELKGAGSVLPLFCSDGAGAAGRLLWRGYGIVNEERGFDSYAGQDVEGAIVLIVRGAPELPELVESEEPDDTALVHHGEGWGNSATLFTKVMNAKRRGAAAVIIAEHPDHEGGMLAFDPSHSAQANIPALYISAAAAGRLRPEFRVNVLQHDPSSMVGVGDSSAKTVEVFADVLRDKGEALNVLGRLRGDGAGPTVVIGAHYDHLGHGGEGSLAGGTNAIHNGADDNASGTAAVLEMARLWSAEGPGGLPAGDIVFALWSGEELGLLGSEYWAQHPTLDLDEVAMNLNLDMVGRAGDAVLTVLGAGTAAGFDDWLFDAALPAGLDLKVNMSGQGVGGSDHQTFLKREIPAVHFFSGLHGDYHKPTDDTERFEAEGAARVVTLGIGLVDAAQASGDLTFIEVKAPESGQASRRSTGWNVWFGSVPDYSFEGDGLLLSGTSDGSPAAKAGLLEGDRIVQVGEVEVQNIYDFMHVLQIYKPGNVVLTRFVRDGEEHEVRITLSTRDAE